ncbi:MAG: hypothetical protein U1F61_12795 [Opitutaceae bacterium]
MPASALFVRGLCLLLLVFLPTLSGGPLEDAESLLRGGKAAEAEAAFSGILATQADNVTALVGRARSRQKLGRNSEARADFDEAVRLAPKSMDALLRRALFHEATSHDGRDALADYSAIVALAPGNAQAYQLRGDFLLRASQSKAALVDAEKAVSLKPDSAATHVLLGRVLSRLGLTDSARRSLNQALKLDANNASARSALAALPPETLPTPSATTVPPSPTTVAADAIGLGAPTLFNPNSDPTGPARAVAAKNEGKSSPPVKPTEVPVATTKTPPEGSPAPSPVTQASTATSPPGPPSSHAPAATSAMPAPTAPQLALLRGANTLRIGVNGAATRSGFSSGPKFFAVTHGGFFYVDLPITWQGDQFCYTGPSPRHACVDRNFRGFASPPGQHWVAGRISADGTRLLSLTYHFTGDDGALITLELGELALAVSPLPPTASMQGACHATLHALHADSATLFRPLLRLRSRNVRLTDLGPSPSAAGQTGSPTIITTTTRFQPYEYAVAFSRHPDLEPVATTGSSLADINRALTRALADPDGWAALSEITDPLLLKLFPERVNRRMAASALEIETVPREKRALRADGHDTLQVRARVRSASGAASASDDDATRGIRFSAEGDGAAWVDLGKPAATLENGWNGILVQISDPDPVRHSAGKAPGVVTLRAVTQDRGKLLSRELRLPVALEPTLEVDPDAAIELVNGSGDSRVLHLAVVNPGESPWEFRAEYAPKSRALAVVTLRPQGPATAELTLREARLEPTHDGSYEERSVLQVTATPPTGARLERDLTVSAAQEGLFVLSTGRDPIEGWYPVSGDGSGKSTRIDFRVFAKDPRTGGMQNLTRDPTAVRDLQVEVLDPPGTVPGNVAQACRFQASVDPDPRPLNEPAATLRVSLARELPSDGRVIPCDVRLTVPGRDGPAYSAIITLGFAPTADGPGSSEWRIELDRCLEVINRFVPAPYLPKMHSMLEKRKMTLGAEGLRELRHRIWLSAAELTLGEGGQGYADEAKWAHRIAETLDWAVWGGDLAFGAVAGTLGGPYAPLGANLLKGLFVSAINAYQEGLSPADWLWQNLCTIPGIIEGKVIDVETFEKLGVSNRVTIWAVYVSYHFLKNLYTERSILQAAKNTVSNVTNTVLGNWLGNEVAKHGNQKVTDWTKSKGHEAHDAFGEYVSPSTPPPTAPATGKVVGSSTPEQGAQPKPKPSPASVAKAPPKSDPFTEAARRPAASDPVGPGISPTDLPSSPQSPSALPVPPAGPEPVAASIVRSRASTAPDGSVYAHPDDTLTIMRDPSLVRALSDAPEPVREAFRNTRAAFYRQHDAEVVQFVKETVPGMKHREVRVLEFRSREGDTSLNTDRDYRVCYQSGVDDQGHPLWTEIDRRRWEAVSYVTFARLTGGPTGPEAAVREWAARHQQRATDRYDSEASAALTDQKSVWNEKTRTFDRIQTERNLERVIASGTVAGIPDAVAIADPAGLALMYRQKVSDARYPHEAMVQANKAVTTLKAVRTAYTLQGRDSGRVPDKLLSGIKIVEETAQRLRADPNRRNPRALAEADRALRSLGFRDLNHFIDQVGGQLESLKSASPSASPPR